MRLTFAALLLVAAAGRAAAGDALIVEGPGDDAPIESGRHAASAVAILPAVPLQPKADEPSAPLVPATPLPDSKAKSPYDGIRDSPLFGHASSASAQKVDESALWYYAGQKDRERVDAEIRRLRSLYPDWRPPSNLYSAGDGRNEQALWDLFSAGRFDELRDAIALRERKESGWRPSADLAGKFARAVLSEQLVGASKLREYAKVAEIASTHPEVLSCQLIDDDWRTAEAFAELRRPDLAFAVDEAILRNCTQPRERLATLMKAAEVLPQPDVDRLVFLGKRMADGRNEFEDVRVDLMRRVVARGGSPDAPPVPPATLAAFERVAGHSGNVDDAMALAWYQYAHGDFDRAVQWFAVAHGEDRTAPRVVEGYATALDRAGRTEKAIEVVEPLRESDDGLRRLYVRLLIRRFSAGVPLTEPQRAALVASLDEARVPEDAASLGWAALAGGTPGEAASWFRKAVDWTPADRTPDDKAVEGYGLALIRSGDFSHAEDVLYSLRDRSPVAAQKLFVTAAAASLAPFESLPKGMQGPVRPMPPLGADMLSRFAEVFQSARSHDGADAMGWYELRAGREAGAVDWFGRALEWGGQPPDAKDVEGMILALKGAGRFVEAEDLAFADLDLSKSIYRLYRSVMSEQLAKPELAKLVAPFRVDRFEELVFREKSSEGAQALGWFRLQLDPLCGAPAPWFQRAEDWSDGGVGDVKINEGLALSLQREGDVLRATDILFDWRDRSPDIAALYLTAMSGALTRPLFKPAFGEAQVGRFEAVVLASRYQPGAEALGWWRYGQAGGGFGVDWFERAIDWSPDGRGTAKIVEGYASALRDVGYLAEAEEVLYPWIDTAKVMKDLYVDTVVSELTLDDPPEPMPQQRIDRFVAVITPIKAAGGAQALGWYRFARREYAESVTWFKNATDWWPTLTPEMMKAHLPPRSDYRPLHPHLAFEAADYQRTPRAFVHVATERDITTARYVDTFDGYATTWYGYALALRAVGRLDEAERIALDWIDRWPAFAQLFTDIAVGRLTDPDGPAVPPAALAAYAKVFEARRDAAGAAALGWSSVRRQDWAAAAVWLKASTLWAKDGAVDPNVFAVYVDALRKTGRPEEAFVAAADRAAAVPALAPALGPVVRDAALDLVDAAARDAVANAGRPGGRVSAASVDRALAVLRADPSAASAAALGWYGLAVRAPDGALDAFKRAIAAAQGGARTPSEADLAVLPKAVEGFALSLRALGRDGDALVFALAWASKVDALRSMPGSIAADLLSRDGGKADVPHDLLVRLTGSIAAAKSPEGAVALGWYDYNRKDWAGAAAAFGDAIRWSPDGRGTANTVEGLVATLMRQCRFEEAASAAAARMGGADGTEALRRLYVDATAARLAFGDRGQPGVKVAAGRSAGLELEPAEATRFAEAVEASRSAAGASSLGWYAYRNKGYDAARAWFEKSVLWGDSEQAEFGLFLVYRRLGDRDRLATVPSLVDKFPTLKAFLRVRVGGNDPAVPDFGGRTCDGEAVRTAASVSRVEESPLADASAPDPDDPTAGLPPDALAATAVYRFPLRSGLRVAGRPRDAASPSGSPRRLPGPSPSEGQSPVPSDGDPDGAAVDASGGSRDRRGSYRGRSASAALNAKDYGRCLTLLAGRRLTASDTTVKGWCLLGLDRPSEADVAFRAAQGSSLSQPRADGALGDTLTKLRLGETAAAEESAARTKLKGDAQRSLLQTISMQKAYDSYQAGRWAETIDNLRDRSSVGPVTRGMVMLRGWSLYHLGDRDSARKSFEEADAQLSDAESRSAIGLLDSAATLRVSR